LFFIAPGTGRADGNHSWVLRMHKCMVQASRVGLCMGV
jgi:hypothetical protein